MTVQGKCQMDLEQSTCYRAGQHCADFQGLSVEFAEFWTIVRPSTILRSQAALFYRKLHRFVPDAFPDCNSSSLRLRAQPGLYSVV